MCKFKGEEKSLLVAQLKRLEDNPNNSILGGVLFKQRNMENVLNIYTVM